MVWTNKDRRDQQFANIFARLASRSMFGTHDCAGNKASVQALWIATVPTVLGARKGAWNGMLSNTLGFVAPSAMIGTAEGSRNYKLSNALGFGASDAMRGASENCWDDQLINAIWSATSSAMIWT